MNIVYDVLNDASCRTYFIHDMRSDEAILVDPIMDFVDFYVWHLDLAGFTLTHVIDTHTHADHISGSTALKERTGCEYVMHRSSKVSGVTWRLDEGMHRVGDIPLGVMHTPGHTKDSISLVLPDRVFVGDCLFLNEGGAGRLDLPGGDAGDHWDSLQRILGLPEQLIVCPAHDYRNCLPSSIGIQKTRNVFLAPRTKDEYLTFAKGLGYGPAEWMRDVLRLNEGCCLADIQAYVSPQSGNCCENICESSATANGTALEHGMAHISAQELRARCQIPPVPILVDVREYDELVGDLPALPGIIHIPIGQMSERINKLAAHKQEPIVIICRSGRRALRAAVILTEAGFTDTSVLTGGMLAWIEK
ncbi:MAG: MBL fold metallo-hydrolase [Patescibacteria group bacterium]